MRLRNPTILRGKYARWVIYSGALVFIAFFLSSRTISFSSTNGFDLTNTLIPAENIYHGGPGRDGIPSIDKPKFISASTASFLKDNDRILGLQVDGEVRAYPIKILNYHEIVNDTVAGQAVVISYCPLCGSGIAFKTELKHQDTTFGVSGLLYNSDMLLYDRATESLWSQIMGTAISGELKGHKLTMLVLENTTWKKWQNQFPATEVLSTRTGFSRDYSRHPYGDYDINSALYFPVSNTNSRYHPKERVVGLVQGDRSKVWPISELAKQKRAIIEDDFAGQSLTIDYDADSQSAVIYSAEHKQIPSVTLFWFAWVAFHPDTEVYNSPGNKEQ